MGKSQAKRILIVDDEPNVTLVLAESLRRLDASYIIDTAQSSAEALSKVRDQHYALVMTDYRMPVMNGLDLAIAIRQLSPDTRIVLMTAYGTSTLRNASSVTLDGYIDKPCTMTQIRQIVEQALGKTTEADPYRTGERAVADNVHTILRSLHADTGARCVMLLSAGGYPVEVVGHTQGLDIATIGALVAANFAAAVELSRLLGNASVFKSSYHEGPDYNVYSYDVNGDLLLAVIFGVESKPGAVWFYTKQAVAALARADLAQAAPLDFGQANITDALDRELDYLFNTPEATTDTPLMSLEEAVKTGLLPEGLLDLVSQD